MRLGRRAPLEARRPPRLPVLRSGTALEVAEVAWLSEGVGRELAMTLPSVAACRCLIVGTVVQLERYRYRGDEQLEPDYLLAKPDPSTSWPTTIAGTVDDLLFHGRAYWRVLERDSEGFVRRARWTPHDDVTPLTRSSGGSYSTLTGYRIAGLRDEVPVDDVIRFDGQAPGVLETGARLLGAAIALEEKARQLASVDLPAGTLKNDRPDTDLGDDELEQTLENFEAMRAKHGVAILDGFTYTRENLSPADLQLIEARYHVATEVARLFSIPVAMIGASPSGGASAMLYSNLEQQLALLSVTSVGPHLAVLEATLSDVIPRGQSVAFDVQSFLRADPRAEAETVIALHGAGIITTAEARSRLGYSSAGSPPDLTPGRP
jgi:HK97 family phage portal protein